MVSPAVPHHERESGETWRRIYDNRNMTTSMNRMQKHSHEHMDHCRQTLAEKHEFFTPHSVPHTSWTNLQVMTHSQSMQRGQPAYFGHINGPDRVGVMPRRVGTPLGARVQYPALNIMSKTGRSFGL